MKTLPLAVSLLALSSVPAFAAPSVATPPPAAAPTPAFYRLDVSITGVDDGPKAAPVAYTLLLEENQNESIHTGWNIPYSAGSSGSTTRQNLGLSMKFEIAQRGAATVLEGEVEMELVEPTRRPPRRSGTRCARRAPCRSCRTSPRCSRACTTSPPSAATRSP